MKRYVRRDFKMPVTFTTVPTNPPNNRHGYYVKIEDNRFGYNYDVQFPDYDQ